MRFIINLPQEELESVERICFQVEEAQWYYEDFIRPLDPDLPSLNLRNFCLRIFQHCPLLSEFSPDHHATAFEEFLAYKTRVPVRGAIMLNDEMDEVVLVKGWKKNANWSFPRGKINKDEPDLDCAVREVYEETGYDIGAAGLVGPPEMTKYIDVAIQHQHVRLYVFRGVPGDTLFEARTRKEISKIEWWKLSDLPTLKKKKQQQEGRGEDLASNANRFYMVAPFLVPLKKWISQQKKMEKSKTENQPEPDDNEVEELAAESNGLDGTQAVSAPGDIERLLAALRNPATALADSHAHIPSMPVADEASQQLKKLLRVVPTSDHVEAEVQNPRAASEDLVPAPTEVKKASTLLALLRGGPPTQEGSAPQTPMERIAAPPSVPESPKPHHTLPPRVSHLPPPPAFPLSPNNGAQIRSDQLPRADDMHKAWIAAWNNFETTSAEQEAARRKARAEERAALIEEEKRTGIRHEQPRIPAMTETWKQVKTGQSSSMRRTEQRQVANVIKRTVGGPQHPHPGHTEQPAQQAALNAPAPYQATSRMPVATNSQYPDIYRLAIPAANKLPIPKLNAHSSSLLNLFKGTQSSKTTQDHTMPSVASRDSVSRPKPETTKDEVQITSEPSFSAMSGPAGALPKAPPLTTHKADEPKQPQTAHQATLLGLFRKPSVSATESTPPPRATLEVPADLVELSATPSPAHSREPSKVDVTGSPKVSSSISGKTVSIQKRPQASTKQGQPPVYATVNGPLNEPHFETVASKARESRQKPSVRKEVKRSPVTILARPATAKVQASDDLPKEAKSNGSRVDGSNIPPSVGMDLNTNKPLASKQFQPQILRRPPQHEKPTMKFEDPIMSKPSFLPSDQNLGKPATPSRLSGSMSDPPPSAKSLLHAPTSIGIPNAGMKIPSQWINDLPEAYEEGQPHLLERGQSQQSAAGSERKAHVPLSGLPQTQPTIERRDGPSPLSASERGPSVKPDHKATLLSLFTRTSPMASPGLLPQQDFSAFVSPLAAKPPSFPAHVLKDQAPKSRLSGFENASNGVEPTVSGNSGDAMQAPRKTTSEVDRKFLLGYLERVARKEGK